MTWDKEAHQAQCLQMQNNVHGEKMAKLEMMVGFKLTPTVQKMKDHFDQLHKSCFQIDKELPE